MHKIHRIGLLRKKLCKGCCHPCPGKGEGHKHSFSAGVVDLKNLYSLCEHCSSNGLQVINLTSRMVSRVEVYAPTDGWKAELLYCDMLKQERQYVHYPLIGCNYDFYGGHCCCCCLFGFKVTFNNFSVILRRCLVATGSSVLTFIVLPHWSIMPQKLDMIPYPVTLSWHWVDQS